MYKHYVLTSNYREVITMKTYIQKKYGHSVINFIKTGKDSFTPDSKKYLIVKAITDKGSFDRYEKKCIFTITDLANFAKLGLAIQVNGNDYLEPK